MRKNLKANKLKLGNRFLMQWLQMSVHFLTTSRASVQHFWNLTSTIIQRLKSFGAYISYQLFPGQTNGWPDNKTHSIYIIFPSPLSFQPCWKTAMFSTPVTYHWAEIYCELKDKCQVVCLYVFLHLEEKWYFFDSNLHFHLEVSVS